MSIISMIGGSGFVGQHLCNAFISQGHQVRIFTRKITQKTFNSNPNVTFIEYNTNEPEPFKNALQDSDILINLVGVFNKSAMQVKHVDFPLMLLEYCNTLKIKHFIHFGALGASATILNDKSPQSVYLKTKSQAEMRLLEHSAQLQVPTTILKPSIIFAENDAFFTQFQTLCNTLPIVLVPCPNSLFQPVYVGDIAKAILSILNNPTYFYRSLELAGPQQYRFIDLVKMTAKYNDQPTCKVRGMPNFMAKLIGKLIGWYPKAPFGYDQYLSLQVPNISNQSAFSELNITPTPLESVLAFRFRFQGQDRYEIDKKKARRTI